MRLGGGYAEMVMSGQFRLASYLPAYLVQRKRTTPFLVGAQAHRQRQRYSPVDAITTGNSSSGDTVPVSVRPTNVKPSTCRACGAMDGTVPGQIAAIAHRSCREQLDRWLAVYRR
ncbi:hypothetical protein JDV02_000515 [Purpureocillium takamizusanense]|uniref:Uncharacterized protein n=1 Tax=Purpureocillium takamizusanense TaxID=2060973 RepID=A0A9Q8Q6B7_9HYPO|nr:uncharacterized protein JDV02_000515 [Purpureocillium takamizusanense]UNI13810.1 hypothetical protein JDV02_000515 [Purpureocillium takamizusanense]